MALSALADASREPTAAELSALLGASASRWGDLVSRVSAAHASVSEVWNFGGARYGWTLRLKRKDRVILYMIPQVDGFLVGLVLGERAVALARGLVLPASVTGLMEQAPKYAEGRGFRVPVKSDEEVAAIVELVALKLAGGAG